MKLHIGDNIRRLRRGTDMTQEQLAVRLGVSYQSVSRWENCQTYPDMELLPAIARLFHVSCDELLGCPKAEKEQAAKKLLLELGKETAKPNCNYEKICGLLKDFRLNFLDTEAMQFLEFNLNYKAGHPEILSEVRKLCETVLEGNYSASDKQNILHFMAKIEDDDHIGKLLEDYATAGLSKSDLLFERYAYRRQPDKKEPIRQSRLFHNIDDLLSLYPLWNAYCKSYTDSEKLELNNLQLNFLHNLCSASYDEAHPISGDGKPDF